MPRVGGEGEGEGVGGEEDGGGDGAGADGIGGGGGVDGVGIGRGVEDLVGEDAPPGGAVEHDVELAGGGGAVEDEYGEVIAVAGGDTLGVGRGSVGRRIRAVDTGLVGGEEGAAAVAGGLLEGEKNRLPPGVAAGGGEDGGDDVDELGEARVADAGGLAEEDQEQAADDKGIGKGVVLLQLAGGGRPARERSGALGHVPDVPLVEGEHHGFFVAVFGFDEVAGGEDVVDLVLHLRGAGEVIGEGFVAVFADVEVEGEGIDVPVAVIEHDTVPVGKAGHAGAGGAAGDEFEGGVELAEGVGGFVGEAAVFLGGFAAGLPGAVHLVAEAPGADVMGRGVAVGVAEVAEFRADGSVTILDELAGGVEAAGAEVDGHHGRGVGGAAPVDEFVGAKVVGLGDAPGVVEAAGAGGAGADAVFPLVGRDEVTAGVAHHGDVEFADEGEHVAAEAMGVCLGVAGLVDAGVNGAAEVFDEAAVETGVDGVLSEVGKNAQGGHG